MAGPYDFSMINAPVQSSRPAGSSAPRADLQYDVLLGQDIHRNAVPSQTVNQNARVVFHDPQGRSFGMDESILSKHLLLMGGIGSGKTNTFNFLIDQTMRRMTDDDVMIIFDTKGDFAEEFYQPGNPRHIMIGNGHEYRRTTLHWNLFGELHDGRRDTTRHDCELVAKEIASQLFKGRGSQQQPFFHMAAADLVSKTICDFLRRAQTTGNSSLLCNSELVRFFRQANVQAYTEMLQRPGNEDFRSAQMYFGQPGQPMTGQALGVFGELNSMVNDLFVGIFGDGGPSGSFSMRNLVRKRGRRVIFVEYDLSSGEVLGPIYRVLFDLALKEALSRSHNEHGSVYLMIDEFKLLPDLMHIDDALNFGRSLGVKVCAGIQSINQLYDIYGEFRGKALLAGFMNSFCFQTWDAESRSYVSERFGRSYTNLAYRTQNEPLKVQRESHTVEDWDVLNLRIGQACVNLVGHPPFIFQFSEYPGRG